MSDDRKLGSFLARLVILLAVIVFLYLSANLYKELNSKKNPRGTVTVEVKKGDSLYELSVILEREKVITSAPLFRLAAEREGIDRSLLPGRYEFLRSSDNKTVIEIIKKGPLIKYVKVTIPEGWTSKQIAARLSSAVGISEKEFLEKVLSGNGNFRNHFSFLKENQGKNLEGYLFPKTYIIKEGIGVDEIISLLLTQFQKETQNINFDKAKSMGYNLHQIIIVASLVERETKIPEEREIVASVIYNRLKRGMKLQIDATIQYALGEQKEVLTLEDLKIDSKYNTYLYFGLPPGPICNPGRDSIIAAANPAKTDFLYYVLITKDGKHDFTNNYEDFLKAKKKYKEDVQVR